jgi:3(or 17)beta-hydroxysteroid dehydrogenase
MLRLDGRVAIITGGSSGIGEACAERFAGEGAHVVVADIRVPRRQVSEANCEPSYFQLDVTDEAAWLELMSVVSSRWGRLDVLINAAGVSVDADTVEACTPESWRRTLEVNLDGTFLGCKHAVRTMKLLGGGAITNIASVLSIVADGEAVAYTASKGGVRMLTKSTALHCAKSGYDIRCNAICPGYIDTPMLRAHLAARPFPEREEARLAAAHPIGRLGRAEEIASIALYLASADASLVTGAEFLVDGGYTAI